ncbi:MAG: FAD-binding oxidoreductase, partial [Planctomycetes bacterium]|nr:FAD-binding oxidoreductase [Planctomycetota bacterium]
MIDVRNSESASARAALERDLRANVRGDVRFDRLSRTIYATDASLYQITPAGVVMPRDVEDVQAAVRVCRAHATPIVAR